MGYLDIRKFVDPELGGDAAAAAMRFLSNTDAVILDFRKSMGGSSDMVALLASYLFGPDPVHLFDMYRRVEDRMDQYWTPGYLPGRRITEQPVSGSEAAFERPPSAGQQNRFARARAAQTVKMEEPA